MRTPFRICALIGAAALVSGCIDQAKNTATFCAANQELLSTSLDEQLVPKELATEKVERKANGKIIEKTENKLSKTMKFSEDADKAVRNAARDLDSSYLDVLTTYTDSKSKQSEYDRQRAQLDDDLTKLKDVCAAAAPNQ
ncbi:MAG: hypothetical protein AB7L13_07970 [Acidimicrobiia bacterium]